MQYVVYVETFVKLVYIYSVCDFNTWHNKVWMFSVDTIKSSKKIYITRKVTHHFNNMYSNENSNRNNRRAYVYSYEVNLFSKFCYTR